MMNMSPREKKLALFVGVVGGLVFSFVGWQMYSGAVQRKKLTVIGLERELSDMEQMKSTQIAMKNRLREHFDKSLPSDKEKAKTEYSAWLRKLASEHIGLEGIEVASQRATEEKSANGVVYETIRTQVKGTGSFLQIVRLLDEYYAADFLHHIASFKIVPISSGQGASRFEKMQLDFTTEAMLIPGIEARPADAPDRSPWRDQNVAIARHRELLTRDFLNPSSDLPSVRTSGGRRFDLGETVRLTLSGSDDDVLNQLKFELDEKSIPEELRGKLKLTQDEDGQAELLAGPVGEGNYRFKVRVSDNGFPAELVEEEVSFSVEKRVADVKPTNVKPEPKLVDFAAFSTITAVLRDVRGRPLVWINVKPEGVIYELTIGDDFEIGSIAGVVEQIEGRTVTILAEGERYRYVTGDVLSEPEVITAVSTVDDTN